MRMLPIVEYINHPRLFFSSLLKETGFLFPDKLYLQMMYYLKTGKRLDLTNPITFGEKLQWLKLYDRRPEYVAMVDKYDVKDYVGKIIGKKYVVPTLGLWNRPEDIDFDVLPSQFVLKTTHGGGSIGVVICKDKTMLDKQRTICSLKKAMKQDLYKTSREWPYSGIKKRVLAEIYLDDSGHSPSDYKVLCFGGKARLIEYHANRFEGRHTQDFYDIEWNKTSISQGGVNTMSDYEITRPSCLDRMIEFSEKLSRDIATCRIDWYVSNQKLYFGEITFFDASGFEPFDKKEDNTLLGSWISLPNRH